AACASMKSPVKSISSACLRATCRDNATPGVEQKRPTLIPETAKLAFSDATTRSHIATSWQPAAVARPCTRAMTGWGGRLGVSIIRLQCRKSALRALRSPIARISLRSWPAQKALPSPAITTTRTDGSFSIASRCSCSDSMTARESELSWRGRARTSQAAAPRSSRRTTAAESAATLVAISLLYRRSRADALTQQELLDLSRRRAGQGAEHHRPRRLEVGKPGPAVLDDLALRGRGIGLELDERTR